MVSQEKANLCDVMLSQLCGFTTGLLTDSGAASHRITLASSALYRPAVLIANAAQQTLIKHKWHLGSNFRSVQVQIGIELKKKEKAAMPRFLTHTDEKTSDISTAYMHPPP